jgi:predicted CXXCH cytochrome family protein
MKLRILTIALIPLLASGAHAAKDSCFECHSVVEGTSVVFKDDVHYTNAVSCADCHGGDAKEDDQNVSMNADRGFKLRVKREGMPDYCGRCHSDANFMRKYKPQQRTDQLALYRTGVHGKRLAAGQTGAAECVDCHSVHNIRAVSDPLSTVHPQNIADTCAKCHAATADLFRKSPHGPVFTSKEMPGCTACHASHATKPAGQAMLTGKHAVCTECHDAGSAGEKAAAEIARLLKGLERTGRKSKEALARARLAIHTCDLAAIRRAAEDATAQNEKAPK